MLQTYWYCSSLSGSPGYTHLSKIHLSGDIVLNLDTIHNSVDTPLHICFHHILIRKMLTILFTGYIEDKLTNSVSLITYIVNDSLQLSYFLVFMHE